MIESLPSDRLLLSYYGDDFSGSTDVMEAFSTHGLPTVLFLEPPSERRLADFAQYRAVGLAGTSRSQSPEWMGQHLPAAFERLKQLGAAICHYKVCSTFDSSPEVGSIGRALEIGQAVFGNPYVPLVVGAPILRRYTVFGNLFATVDGLAYRLDRHPTMMRHPVTPMTEGDLRVHLAAQTAKRIALVDILALESGDLDRRFEALLAEQPDIVLFDVLDHDSMIQVGRLLWSRRARPQTFVVGSSGLEYALIAYWRASGLLPEPPALPSVPEADRLIVVSGSCSPTTAAQIEWALARGFAGVRLDPVTLASGDAMPAAVDEATRQALEVLKEGRSVVVYTALGPQDMVRPEASAQGGFQQRLGCRLGRILQQLLLRSGVRRVVVAGGDTSGQAGRRLGLHALTLRQPFAPGSPLCLAHADDPALAGLEVLFKGGQVGAAPLFEQVRRGRLDV